MYEFWKRYKWIAFAVPYLPSEKAVPGAVLYCWIPNPSFKGVHDLCKDLCLARITAEEADVGGNTWFMGFSFANTAYQIVSLYLILRGWVYGDRNGP